jgi:hypothetical protein
MRQESTTARHPCPAAGVSSALRPVSAHYRIGLSSVKRILPWGTALAGHFL